MKLKSAPFINPMSSPFGLSYLGILINIIFMASVGCLWFTANASFPWGSMYFDKIFKQVVLGHTLIHSNIPQIIRKV